MGLTNDDAPLAPSPRDFLSTPRTKRKLESTEDGPESYRPRKSQAAGEAMSDVKESEGAVQEFRVISTPKPKAKGSALKRTATKKADTADEKRLRMSVITPLHDPLPSVSPRPLSDVPVWR